MAVHEQKTWKPRAWLKQWERVFKIHEYNLLHKTPTLFISKHLHCSLQIISSSPFSPTSHPFPLPHRKLANYYSGAHRPVCLDPKVHERVNGAWCKRRDIAVCSRFTAKLPIQQLSKALKHVLQAHLKHIVCPSPTTTHRHTYTKRKREIDHPSNHSLKSMVDNGIQLALLDRAVFHHRTGWWCHWG